MMNEGCTVEVQDGAAGAPAVVTVTGEVDASNCAEVRAALDRLAGVPHAREVHLDLGRLTFVDSSGLRVFLVGQIALQQRGGSLRITEASPAVERLLEITGLRAQLR